MMIRFGLIACETIPSMLPPSQLSPVGSHDPRPCSRMLESGGIAISRHHRHRQPARRVAVRSSNQKSTDRRGPCSPWPHVEAWPRRAPRHDPGRFPPVRVETGVERRDAIGVGGNKRSTMTPPPLTSPTRTSPCVTGSMHRASNALTKFGSVVVGEGGCHSLRRSRIEAPLLSRRVSVNGPT